MEGSINEFISRLEDNRSLRPLYRSTDFRVEMKTERNRYLLTFNKDGCHRLFDLDERMDVVISGRERQLLRVVEGEKRLLEMSGRGILTAEGSYRRLLKLESLFLLNGTEKYLIYQLS